MQKKILSTFEYRKIFMFVAVLFASIQLFAVDYNIEQLLIISEKNKSDFDAFLEKETDKTLCEYLKIHREIYSHDFLFLTSLQSISIQTAKNLREWPGKYLFLNGLLDAAPEVYTFLFEWQGTLLSLDNIEIISPQVAKNIATWTGKYLSLNGVENIEEHVALYLGKFQGILHLDNLQHFSLKYAKYFNKKRKGLYLNSIKEIDSKAMIYLTKSDILSLNSLENIDDDFFIHLDKWKGTLYLNNLSNIKKASKYIAKWKGVKLYLNGVKKLDFRTCRNLANWRGKYLYFEGIENVAPSVIKKLIEWKGYTLSFGIRDLNKETASILAQWNGYELDLPKIEKISLKSLVALIKWNGSTLRLGIAKCSLEQAKIFSKWKGNRLFFKNFASFSPEVLKVLRSSRTFID